ncbi:MAG: response regulator [Gammaproteobacteria bacterium]|nr:response regulator [Gammaproteobacteria bacterium]
MTTPAPAKKILYVEDDSTLARLVQILLSHKGYTVDLACNGREGIEKIKANHYDVVLVDYRLPELDGLDLIRLLADEERLPPAIMVSGTDDLKVAVQALKLGAADYILKGLDRSYMALLPATVEQVLEKQRLIEEKRRAETSLRETNEFLKKVMESASDTICVFDLQGKFKLINRAGEKMSAYTSAELLGQHFSMILPEEAVPCISEQFANAAVHGMSLSQYETEIARKDGKEAFICLSLAPMFQEEKIVSVVGTAEDVTQRHQAEEKLRLSTAVFDNAAEGIMVTDAQQRIQIVNRAFTQVTGYPEQEVLGRRPALLSSGHHDKAFFLQMRESLQQTGRWEGEIINRRKNGNTYPEWLSISPIRGMQGEVTRYIGLFSDISDRKRTEAELLKAKANAEAANRAKSTFLANMSHEIRTPLNGILGFAQILGRDKTLGPQQQQGIHVIQQSGRHLLNLINEILDLSKVEAGRMELHSQEFIFSDFLRGIADIIQVRAEKMEIEFMYTPSSFLPAAVKTDETRLRQILLNLLGNAVKFTPQGMVNFEVRPHNGLIRFQVADSGTGIPVDQLESIFLPFQQADNQPDTQAGTGLGLAISKKFVEMMGGSLTVESAPGKGSIFRVDLALPEVASPQQLEELSKQQHITGYKGKRRKILVVDDEGANRMVLANLLSSMDFDIYEAANGHNGVAQALKHRPAAVLMDLRMPGIDGFEATRQIRQHSKLKHTVIIIVSTGAYAEFLAKSQAAGADDFISKPVIFEELHEKLQTYLQLEWTCEHVERKPRKKDKEKKKRAFTVPSVEALGTLYELAKQGDLLGLIDEIDQLEQKGSEFAPFVEEARRLAEEIELKKLIKLIKQVKHRN